MVTYFLVLVIPLGHLVMISKMVMYRQIWIQRAELVMKRGNGYCFQFFGDETNQSPSIFIINLLEYGSIKYTPVI